MVYSQHKNVDELLLALMCSIDFWQKILHTVDCNIPDKLSLAVIHKGICNLFQLHFTLMPHSASPSLCRS